MDYYDYGLSMGLAEHGCQITFHTCSKTEIRTYKNVKTSLTFGNLWDKPKILTGLWLFFGYFRSLMICKKNGCDVVHFHFFNLAWRNYLVLLLANKFFNVRIVSTIHDVDSFKSSQKTLDSSFGLIDQIIVHNEFSKRELLSKGVDEIKIHVIPHGNYLPFVDSISSPPKGETELLKLLFFGQIKEIKGLDILLNAMALVKKQTNNIHLTIAGRPWHYDSSKYENIIQDNKLDDYVTTRFEFIPDEEVEGYFESTDVVVLPYKRIYQSGVLLLAMSYGRPVLASSLPAFTEIIEESKTGFLFEPNNPQSLAEKILDIQKNKIRLQAVSNCATEKLQSEFDWGTIAQKTIIVYKR